MTPEEIFLHLLIPGKPHQELGKELVPADWYTILALAEFHRVQPLILRQVQDLPIDEESREYLATASRAAAANTLLLLNELEYLAQEFARKKITPILLKGPLLAKALWGEPTCRESHDLDILIPPDQLMNTLDIFEEMGYKEATPFPSNARKRYLAHRYHLELYHPQRNTVIELHWAIMPPFLKFDFPPIAELWADRYSEPLNDYNRTFRVFKPDFNFIFLLLHAYRHGWEVLAWVMDPYYVQRHYQLDWEKLRELATSLGMERVFIQFLALLQHIDQQCVGGDLRLTEREKRFIAHLVEHWFHFSYLDSRFKLYQIYAKGLRPRDQLYFWLYLLFMPTTADLEWCFVPQPLSFLYTVLRPVRLLRELIAGRGKDAPFNEL